MGGSTTNWHLVYKISLASLVNGRLSQNIILDFDDDKLVCGGALYKSAPIKTKGRGAQGKMLECFCLAKQFNPYFNQWMKYRKENNIESEWLFPDPVDPTKHLQISTMNSWANTFSRMLGVPVYFHSMRHMCVTNFKRAGIPDSVIQQYIGWKDISMVSVYDDSTTDEQLSMYFTESGIVTPKAKSFDLI